MDLPRIGAATFPASHVPPRGSNGVYTPGSADWPYADVTYLDVNGRAVNTAGYTREGHEPLWEPGRFR